jgi:hypothetical protein
MKKIAIFGLFVLLASACSSDSNDSTTGTVTLKASSIISPVALTGKAVSTTILSDFKVNIGKIKFETDESNENHNTNDSIYEDVKLIGPFLLDLLNPDQTLNQLITSVDVPIGKYEEIKLKFEKSIVEGEMFGKTYLIKGKINNKDIMIWSDKELQIGIDFEDQGKDLSVDSNAILLVIKIKLDAIIAKINELDSQNLLLDTNGDGIIEISTTAVDGNQEIGNQIRSLLQNHSHLDDRE